MDLKATLTDKVKSRMNELIALCSELVRINSENPPGDTNELGQFIAFYLSEWEGVEVEAHPSSEKIFNLVARTCGNGSGKRLILNGHLDTFALGDPSLWTKDPLGGMIEEERLYGRGSADMKGGIACLIWAMLVLSEFRDHWNGEIVLTLAGDEETMGYGGTYYLLEKVPHALGDGIICADVGSPKVARFGEKGMIWLDIEAKGRPAHGAHVHRGQNAIELLLKALEKLFTLNDYPTKLPQEVEKAIMEAKPVSEPLGGAGEADILKRITVNLGRIGGGTSPNLVASKAQSSLDIRLPVGVSLKEIEEEIAGLLNPMEDISWRITTKWEPNWTSLDQELVQTVLKNAQHILQEEVVANMRVGASDARLYRLFGVPTVVYGLTPHNLGGPDEYIRIEELEQVCAVYTISAWDYLRTE
jgi:succinyl-diaminopimelate desuccinylase